MRQALYFLFLNRRAFLGLIIGSVLGFFFWQTIGFQWGAYPLSSECWVNCVYGALFGGLIGNVFEK